MSTIGSRPRRARLALAASLIAVAGCSSAPRVATSEFGAPPPDLSQIFDFTLLGGGPDVAADHDFGMLDDLAMVDAAVPSDLAVPDDDQGHPGDAAGPGDGGPADLAVRDGAPPGDAASKGDAGAGDAGAGDAAPRGDAAPGDSGGAPLDGSADLAVAKADLEINYCVVQFPKSTTAQAGMPSPQIFGQVFQGGLTDVTMDKPAPGIAAQLGYGPLGSDPRVSPAWTWIVATPNPGFDWKMNNDEYLAVIPGRPIGVYSYAYRFSVTAGAGYTYCDTVGNGNNNGLPLFDPAKTGQLTVN